MEEKKRSNKRCPWLRTSMVKELKLCEGHQIHINIYYVIYYIGSDACSYLDYVM